MSEIESLTVPFYIAPSFSAIIDAWGVEMVGEAQVLTFVANPTAIQTLILAMATMPHLIDLEVPPGTENVLKAMFSSRWQGTMSWN